MDPDTWTHKTCVCEHQKIHRQSMRNHCIPWKFVCGVPFPGPIYQSYFLCLHFEHRGNVPLSFQSIYKPVDWWILSYWLHPARCHASYITVMEIEAFFEDHNVSKDCGQQGPQIFSCGAHWRKWSIQTNKPCTIDDLKENIFQEIAAIPVDMIQFKPLHPVVLGQWGTPLPAPHVMGYSLTRTEVDTGIQFNKDRGWYLQHLSTIIA
jgi:hypothetical protein